MNNRVPGVGRRMFLMRKRRVCVTSTKASVKSRPMKTWRGVASTNHSQKIYKTY